MIKHRFIVRGADDFRIFAAIPSETQVLTWKRWLRPPDWAAFRAMSIVVADVFAKIEKWWEVIAGHSDTLANVVIDVTAEERARRPDEYVEMDKEWDVFVQPQRLRAMDARTRSAKAAAAVARIQALSVDASEDTTPEQIVEAQKLVLELTETVEVSEHDLGLLRKDVRENIKHYERKVASGMADTKKDIRDVALQVARAFLTAFKQINESHQHVLDGHGELLRILEASRELTSSEPLADTPCPPGVPFASYTIEFKETVFSVVEGCAWVSARVRPSQQVIDRVADSLGDAALDKLAQGVVDEKTRAVVDAVTDHAFEPTADEKRVVEIVTQMLVERGLNPKAETRIPVTDADPKHANQQRDAEKRDEHEGRAPKVRTIKFHVAPPRYLREAAERIFATPGKHKKAHWVIGHWRNQACGVGHKEHRQQWIKPHIRGLGEAGAVVVRVAASDEEVAGRA
jgi:hypothetical protein